MRPHVPWLLALVLVVPGCLTAERPECVVDEVPVRVDVVGARAPVTAVAFHTGHPPPLALGVQSAPSCGGGPSTTVLPATRADGAEGAVPAGTYGEVRVRTENATMRAAASVPLTAEGTLRVGVTAGDRVTVAWNGEALDVRVSERWDAPDALDPVSVAVTQNPARNVSLDRLVEVRSAWNDGFVLDARVLPLPPTLPDEVPADAARVALIAPDGTERMLARGGERVESGPVEAGTWNVRIVLRIPDDDTKLRVNASATLTY